MMLGLAEEVSMSSITEQHIVDWQEQGFAIIEGFLSPEEFLPVRKEYEGIYGLPGASRQEVLSLKKEGSIGEFRSEQFKNIDELPYAGSAELNMLSLHPKLIEFAKQLLGVEDVHLYQSHTWAKFTGEADYDQTFHCDYGNHTLTIPSEDRRLRSVDFILYLTDVTDAHGALHYVTKPDADGVLRQGAVSATEAQQQQLLGVQRSAAGPAGTLVAHSIDTFHRGTNLTEPNGHRFTMTVGYKAAGNDMIGYQVWQQQADRPWSIIFANASPAQLACLGIPLPGNPYWTERTLKLSQARWPDWDMSEYFSAGLA
ncbi:MAG: hypothetical protein ACJAX5_002521 [Patiriisocius sp.]|jgi:hypothetical protein